MWLQHSQHVTCSAMGPHGARSSVCLRVSSWRCTPVLPHRALPALLSSSANSQQSRGWWDVQSRRHSTAWRWRHLDRALLLTQLRTDSAVLSFFFFFSLTKYSNNCFWKNEGQNHTCQKKKQRRDLEELLLLIKLTSRQSTRTSGGCWKRTLFQLCEKQKPPECPKESRTTSMWSWRAHLPSRRGVVPRSSRRSRAEQRRAGTSSGRAGSGGALGHGRLHRLLLSITAVATEPLGRPFLFTRAQTSAVKVTWRRQQQP